jgi:hypothetical protein
VRTAAVVLVVLLIERAPKGCIVWPPFSTFVSYMRPGNVAAERFGAERFDDAGFAMV